MANRFRLEFAGKTDTGLVRSHNEDCIAFSPAYGLAILADGMGGYSAGEVASGIAVGVLKEALEEGMVRLQSGQHEFHLQRPGQIHQLMDEAIHRANSAILEAARVEPRYDGMGTTLVTALFHGDSATVAHVGDSRAYRLRQGDMVQITKDHSLLQEQIDAGVISPEWAQFSPIKNLVTRAVGVGPEMKVDIHDHRLEAGDLYLLCSDGLSDMLTDQEICDMLMDYQSGLEAACEALVQKANKHGGRDNISVILTAIRPSEEAQGGLVSRIFRWMK